MAIDGAPPDGAGPLTDTVLVSNRGPLAFRLEDGRPVAAAAGGGLAGSIHPTVRGTGATWVACALGEADRAAAAAGMMNDDGLRIELVDPDPEMFRMAYNVVSNATLWFCHHHLSTPPADRGPTAGGWRRGRRTATNELSPAVAEVAPEGGRVLVQDYHLALMGSGLARLRPDLRTAHFSHTPFADPSVLRMLPTAVGTELLTSMAGFGACGFHTERWAAAYRQGLPSWVPPGADPIPPSYRPCPPTPKDCAPRRPNRRWPANWLASRSRIGGPDRQVIVRVDRMELSKNLLRGFWAFEELLESQPHRRQRVVFVALAYPTRQGLPEYLAYQNEVESTVARINQRWAVPGWTPIVLEVEDDYQRSLAALSRYDVLLVNPVRDGLNLVAKEGPLINTRNGVLALSREAGAFEELGPAALEINPFDVSGTAAVLAQALDMDGEERAERVRRAPKGHPLPQARRLAERPARRGTLSSRPGLPAPAARAGLRARRLWRRHGQPLQNRQCTSGTRHGEIGRRGHLGIGLGIDDRHRDGRHARPGGQIGQGGEGRQITEVVTQVARSRVSLDQAPGDRSLVDVQRRAELDRHPAGVGPESGPLRFGPGGPGGPRRGLGGPAPVDGHGQALAFDHHPGRGGRPQAA